METISTANIKRNYRAALAIIAALLVLAFISLRTVIDSEKNRAALINISGRQRMLSQQIAFFSFQLVKAGNVRDRRRNRRVLRAAAVLMETSNSGLIHGSRRLGLSPPSPAVRAIFFKQPHKLNAAVNDYIAEVKALARTPTNQLNFDNPHFLYITSTAPTLLNSLNEVVEEYQRESETAITRLREIQATALSFILIILLLEALFIFRPMVANIQEKTAGLEAAYQEKLKIAATLQKNLVPQRLPKIPGLNISFYYQSATHYAEVGGDFYDIFAMAGNRWGIVVGDVAGKGIEVAADTAKIKYLLRDRALNILSPEDVLASVNNTLVKQQAERFTAITYAVYHPESSTLTLSNAGNPYPYLVPADIFFEVTAVPISIFADQTYPVKKIRLRPGDTIILYTDGLIEVRREKDFFGMEGLREFVVDNQSLSLEKLLSGLIDAARDFSHDHLTDDTLVMGLRQE